MCQIANGRINKGLYCKINTILGRTHNKVVSKYILSVGQHDKFIKAAIAFYRESLRYALLKMNVDSSFWEMA